MAMTAAAAFVFSRRRVFVGLRLASAQGRGRPLQAAATSYAGDTSAAPLVAPLTEVVQAQADRVARGDQIAIPEWVEILQRHFPPDGRGK
ncbi:hypothetical protein [Streptomyces sp. NEAU-S7GS2]|uniref:hypothetical protein n=1 Tax=Streptomyces sp. NEAU-S7GS2 TaxID=2202000 RepID=UPI000D6FF112|nr:hypothetical protein [Streptomyces sp. NEAU-S7GS2]AWN24842.1 hypothetical protein DKG71_00420 [Streptomyces sp. NEAU-S7GS2]